MEHAGRENIMGGVVEQSAVKFPDFEQIKVYVGNDLVNFPWNSVDSGEKLQQYYQPLIEQGTSVYIRNSNQQVGLVKAEKNVIPITLNKKGNTPQNTYLLSFLAQYFDYAQEEVLKQRKYSAIQKGMAKYSIGLVRKIAELLKMEKVVFVNNQLLSTNLYPKLSKETWVNIANELQTIFPQHAIVFRTLNEETNQDILAAMAELQPSRITCRRVYILPKDINRYRRKRAYVRDQKLWEKSSRLYWEKQTSFSASELEKILRFYEELYIKKYSVYNPIYTKKMIEASTKSGLLSFYVLREQETRAMKAVQAVAVQAREITTPFIGYDAQEPVETGLYRLMNLQLMELAVENKLRLNMSSGAAQFKMQRGGEATFDNHMVLYKHLPKWRHFLWNALAFLSDKFVRPTLEKMKL